MFLLMLGAIMLISTCAFSATAPSDDVYHDAKRQAVWLIMGFAICWLTAKVDYQWWRSKVWWIYGTVTVLLILCYLPGIGQEINNEKRWINARLIGLEGLQLQPSEFAKISMAVLLAYWFSMHPDCGARFWRGFGIPLVVAGATVALVLFEKDMGTAAILFATFFSLMFVAGVKWRYLLAIVLMGTMGLWGMLQYAPDRMKRITAFLDIEKYKLDEAFQQWIALMALGSGGIEGRGLGSGRLKMLYMPFAHTDFIFPMIGEELGLPFTLLVVTAFVLIAIAGIAVAFYAPDRFGKLLGAGLVCFIVYQGMLNMGVTTATLPNTGLPLPFVSYGGSSLLTVMAAIGILFNIYRKGRQDSGRDLVWHGKPRISTDVFSMDAGRVKT